jgi:hypothetical protein
MQGAAEVAKVNAVRVNVLSVGQVQVHSAVVRALREDYTKDLIYSTVYENPGEQFTKSADVLLYDAERRLCVPNGRLRIVLMHDAHDAIVKGHLGSKSVIKTCRGALHGRLCVDMSRSMCARVIRVRGTSLAASCQLVCLTRRKYPLVVWSKLLLTLSWSCRARHQLMMPSWLLWIDCRKLSVFVLRRRMWTLLGLRSCSSIIGVGTMVSRARLCRTVMGVSLASFGKSCSG